MNTEPIQQPLTLPCGVTLTNRIVKSAMSENMAGKDHRPSKELIKLYDRWSTSGAAVLVTGNVMIDRRALGEPHNVVIEDERHLEELKQWAQAGKRGGSQMWMQINHPGRQAPGTINKDVVSASAVQLKGKFVFKKPRPLSTIEINDLIERYGNTAAIAQKAGFDGVQIHGAHGYLVSQFLSPHTNEREDEWGGSLQNRARFVIEVYRNMRKKTGSGFPIGIKINSADFQRGGFTEEDSMEVIDLLSNEGIDLIEISGGTYEVSAMMGSSKKKSTADREAYFMDYIIKARKRTTKPLMLTGGFRSTAAMSAALENNELDIIGMARPFALHPDLVNEIIDGAITKVEVPIVRTNVKAIDKMGFLDVIWHSVQLERMGKGQDPDPKLSPWKAVWKMSKDALPFG